MMRSRPVKPRASRMALMAASVPEETMRTISTDGIAFVINSARCVSRSVGAPKLAPWRMASVTAATTRGWAWPRISGPHEPM